MYLTLEAKMNKYVIVAVVVLMCIALVMYTQMDGVSSKKKSFKQIKWEKACIQTHFFVSLQSTRKVLGDGQPLTELISVRVEKATATVKTTKEQEIDITMKLGGKVWCDERVGKETKLDGKYSDGEKLMSGIKVILHQLNFMNRNKEKCNFKLENQI